MKTQYKPINIVLLMYLGLYLPYILIIIVALLSGGTYNTQDILDGIIYFNFPYMLPDGWLNNVYTQTAFGILQACIIFSYLYTAINPGAGKRWAYIGISAIFLYFVLFVLIVIFSVFFLLARWG